VETVDAIVRFISSYPIWAKLLLVANLACIALTLILTPRTSSEEKALAEQGSRILRIEGVELFPESESAEIQVSAFVNGTEFRYPSVAGVEWLNVAPSMSGQTFKLPKAETYELRIEMRKRQPPESQLARLVSQETVTLGEVPFSGTYRLHGFDPSSRTRSGEVSAQVKFSFQAAK
jgi:hypothetical protein